MIVENHAKGPIAWPNKNRVAVAITFDFQGGEPVRPGKNGKLNNEDYAEGEYGPKTGIWPGPVRMASTTSTGVASSKDGALCP